MLNDTPFLAGRSSERSNILEFGFKDDREVVKISNEAYKQTLKDINAEKTRLNTLDKYLDSSYSTSPLKEENNLLSRYKEDAETGWITPLIGFEDYVSLYNQINEQIVGLTTINGITITGQSKHFLQRMIGTRSDPITGHIRSGVEIEDVIDALLNGKVKKEKEDADGRLSQSFYNDICLVTINPTTGILVQCNPHGRK